MLVNLVNIPLELGNLVTAASKRVCLGGGGDMTYEYDATNCLFGEYQDFGFCISENRSFFFFFKIQRKLC